MGLVTDTDDPLAPVVLIVDNNQMTLRRLQQALKDREFNLIECTDGDKAVDMYAKNEPDLVVMALDIPTLDGHVAALEIREMDPSARIMFTAPKRLRSVAENATFSAGAVAWVEKPITKKSLDDVWDKVLGKIPEAPGLEDLDTLYPENIDNVEEISPENILPDLPPLPGLPLISDLPPLDTVITSQPPPFKKRKRMKKFILFIFFGLVAGYVWSIFGDIPFL